jgi:hypothetical protein
VKAIQTRYAGCHFRSRLEARWAVAMDHLGVKWEYEPQGFRMTSGACYLADFWLPSSSVYLEIKGPDPTTEEISKGLEMAAAIEPSGGRYRMLVGDVPRQPVVVEGMYGVPALTATRSGRRWQMTPSLWSTQGWNKVKVQHALVAARSARFEHGESPK